MRFCMPCDRIVRRMECEHCGADTDHVSHDTVEDLEALGYQKPRRQSRKTIAEYEAEVSHAYAEHTDVRR